jgi:hypothetical protein
MMLPQFSEYFFGGSKSANQRTPPSFATGESSRLLYLLDLYAEKFSCRRPGYLGLRCKFQVSVDRLWNPVLFHSDEQFMLYHVMCFRFFNQLRSLII